jgi:hypothetical protein
MPKTNQSHQRAVGASLGRISAPQVRGERARSLGRCKQVLRLTLFILTFALLAGCETGPGYDEQVRRSYHAGMSRDEAHALLAQPAMSSVSRPTTGWSPTDDTNHQASRAAFHYEREHPDTRVYSCEVYLVGRHTSAPLAVGGIWWDYLFFDCHDNLIGYHRRFLD